MSRETCWMRCAMPQPCMGSSARVFRINRSSVPCRISTAGLMQPPLDELQVKYYRGLVDCQRERGRVKSTRGRKRNDSDPVGAGLRPAPTVNRDARTTPARPDANQWPRFLAASPCEVRGAAFIM